MQTVKALILAKTGDLKNLKFTSVDKPVPGKGEVLIKVLYSGLNHLDLHIIAGTRPGIPSFPHILGSEIVGKTEEGDKVAVYPWTFCGKCRECKMGFKSICDQGGTFGRTRWGGYAEYVVVPEKNLVKIPNGISEDQVCASILSSSTAYHLMNRAKIKEGSTVLVTGATGGVGTAVLQLLKNKNCKVVCTTSHPQKRKLLRKIGADVIVSAENMLSVIKKLYPSGLDFIIDIMGGQSWSDSAELLAKNGTLTFCATTLEGEGKVNIAKAFARQVNILGCYGGNISDLKAVLKMLEKGVIDPVIDSVFPLERAIEALSKLKQQKTFGKILLKI